MDAPADVTTENARSFKELKEDPLYADRVQIYPKAVSGLFRRIKWAVLIALLGLYYIVPWIRWDRGPNAPDQAVLVDMPGRRLYFFFIEIWPQEIYYLTFILMAASFGLFLATAIGGRVWCGFTCPQTVWTDLFMWVERKIQGDRSARIRLEKQPWSAEKAWKKGATHGAWLLIAAATGGVWIMYFNDAPTVTYEILTGQAGLSVYFFFGLFTFTTYLLAGWAREQVCTYMCPWPRIQAALLDQDSYVVTYEQWRGEPRGPHKKGTSWEGRGDCVACNQCVAVCPMGIDIRDGLQLECIGCGLCVDACNQVMARVDRPLNLITLDTERNQFNRAAGGAPVRRLVRPRTIIYVVILAVLGLGVLIGLTGRAGLDLNVLPDRNPLFVKLADGSIRNGYTVKVLNRVREAKTYALTVEGLDGATLSVLGLENGDDSAALLDAEPDQVSTYRLFVTAPSAAVTEAVQDLRVVLTDQDDQEAHSFDTIFRGPK
ncbi:MAG: cytochrome c oxidase accessory protein CcoG [Alphaproteobacteria bacterium]|nr:cytochrome c oxidase accessory protein CcoG [Alphaproteobacteria bacterium]